MNRIKIATRLLLISFCVATTISDVQGQPIGLHPENPHYFIYKNKPLILITSGEHYGAVLNLDFNYRKYINELYTNRLNLTRLFSGAYVEPQGAFNIERNTLAPARERYLCPWSRSKHTGYNNGRNTFDLTQWDTAYFYRLKDCVAEAEKRNIIVELTLFCPFYEDSQWLLSPMNAINNVNGVGNIIRTDVYTLDKNGPLLKVQEDLVRKIVTELKGFNNIIYEICNEPYFGGVTMEWQHHIASLIYDIENNFGTHHLISQNIANASMTITDPHPAVSVFNFHYATPPVTVAMNYHLNKVIGDNETGFNGNSDSVYRKEGWQFIMAGGGLYNNLDYSFAPGYENGTFKYGPRQPGGGSTGLRKQLGYLKEFMNGLDYIHMQPDSTVAMLSPAGKQKVYCLMEKGKQYALYITGGKPATIEVLLPAGSYSVEWMNPVTGIYQKGKQVESVGKIMLHSPPFMEDIALRIMNSKP